MRIIIVDASNRQEHRDVILRSRQLRHDIFIRELNWPLEMRADGLEHDDFDTDRSVEMIVQEDNGIVVGYSRFLPTSAPHLLSHVYPHLCTGPLPSAPNLYEWTRLAVARGYRGDKYNFGSVTLSLFIAAAKWGLENQMRAYIGEIDSALVAKLELHLFRIVPLGVAHIMDGISVVAVRAEFDAQTLAYLLELQRKEKRQQRSSNITLGHVQTPTRHLVLPSDLYQNEQMGNLDHPKARL